MKIQNRSCCWRAFISGLLVLLAINSTCLAGTKKSIMPVFFRNHAVTTQADKSKLPENLRYCLLEDFALNFLRGQRGNGPAMVAAMERIQCPPNIPADDTKTYRLRSGKKLIHVLDMLQFNSNDIPEFPEGETATVTLGRADNQFSFTFRRLPERGWVAAWEMLESKEFEQAYKRAKEIQLKHATSEVSFIDGLESPEFALRTFYCGVNGILGYTQEDAIRAMNLPETNDDVKEELGGTWSVELYRLLKYSTDFELTSMSSNPNHESPVVLLTDMTGGLITLIRVTDEETGKQAWKIDIDSIDTLNRMYDAYMRNGMKDEIGSMLVTLPPIHVALDDFFWQKMPSLENYWCGMNIWKWLTIGVLLVLSLLLLPLIRFAFRMLLRIMLRRSDPRDVERLGKRFIMPLQITAMGYLWLEGTTIIIASPTTATVAMFTLQCVLSLTISWLSWLVTDGVILSIKGRTHPGRLIVIDMVGYFIKTAILVVLALQLCSLFDLDGTKFFAALGIGGLALAMAGREAIASLIGTLLIMADRPFHIGDLITIGETTGTVERVGLRSTTIRTFPDSRVTIPNSQFTSMQVDNLSRRLWRRYRTSFSVLYSTPPELLTQFVEALRKIAEDHPNIRKDNLIVHVEDLVDCSISIVINIYFRNRGYQQEMADRETFIVEALKAADDMGISYAFPTRTLHFGDTTKMLPFRQDPQPEKC